MHEHLTKMGRTIPFGLACRGVICSDWLPVETLMFRGNEPDAATQMVVEAGTDVFGGASPRTINDIVRLVKSGDIPESRIDESVTARRAHRAVFERHSAIGHPGTVIDVTNGEWVNRESHISGW